MRTIVIYALATLLVNHAALAAEVKACSNKTLHGSYILSANGVDKTPIAEAGMIAYDGAGNVLFKGTYSNKSEISLKGTYKVESSCRGEVTYEDGRTVTLFIDPSGNEIAWVVTSGPILASNSRRVSQKDLLGIKP